MANKYTISAPLPALHFQSYRFPHHFKHPVFDIGYIRGKGFLPPSGVDNDRKQLIPEIPAEASWYRCKVNQANIEWVVEVGGRKLSFIDFSGVIVFEYQTKVTHEAVHYLRLERPSLQLPHGRIEGLHITDYYSGEVVLGASCVIWKKGVSLIPDEMVNNERLAGWCWWDGDLIVWSPTILYNVSTEEIMYSHISERTPNCGGPPTQTAIGIFLDGCVIICVKSTEQSGCLCIDAKHRIKITKKAKKPKNAVVGDCPICFEAKPKRMAYNCDHAQCCVECSEKLKKCPFCRAKITVRLPIYS